MKKRGHAVVATSTLVIHVVFTSLLLFFSLVDLSYSQRTWYFDKFTQLTLFIMSNLTFLLSVLYNGKFKNMMFYKLFTPLYFFLALDLSRKFRYAFLTNPFDTTGIRGLYSDILTLGRIPSTGFYVEYAGQYNKLFVGPLHTVTWILVSNVTTVYGLDGALKFYESFLKIFLYLCFFMIIKTYSKYELESSPSLTIFLGLVCFSFTLTLQTYALPLLAILLYILTRIFRSPNRLDLLIFTIFNIALINTHFTASLIFTMFIVNTVIMNFVVKEGASRTVRIIAVFSISLFFVKFLYDAIRYFRIFYVAGSNLIQGFYEVLFGKEPVSNPQLESLTILKEKMSFVDYLSLFLVRLMSEMLVYSFVIGSLLFRFVIGYFKVKERIDKFRVPLNLSFQSFIVLILLLELFILVQSSLYTALAMAMFLFIFNLFNLPDFFAYLEKRSWKMQTLLLSLIIITNIVAGNTLFVPQISGQPVAAYHNVNTIYKINIISFSRVYLEPHVKISSDIVTGWQIMGYAPQLFRNYIWSSPIIDGFLSPNTLVLIPTPDFKAGFLNEPLKYRVKYQVFFENVVHDCNLIYQNGGMVGLFNMSTFSELR